MNHRAIAAAAVALVAVARIGAAQSFAEQIGTVLDGWHHAAAVSDEVGYFGRMTDSAVFLGTDPGERWVKAEFRTWAAPQFKRAVAWDFHPHDRHISLADDGKTAWFDELLDTWMGRCRGTGVMRRIGDAWQIQQYSLGLLVANDRVLEVIKLLKGPPTKP